MTPNDTNLIHPISFVLASLSVGVMAVTLTFACTWMTNRKRRVGSHVTRTHGNLVLEASPAKNARSGTTSEAPRYASSPGLSPHTADILHPAIIITPPTPLAMFANSALLQSDSSIGSAADLMVGHGDQFSSENPDISISSSMATPPPPPTTTPPLPPLPPNEANFCGGSLNGEDYEKDLKERELLKERKIKEFKCNTFVFNNMIEYDHRTSQPKNITTTTTTTNNNINTSNQSIKNCVVKYNRLPDINTTEVTSNVEMTSSSTRRYHDERIITDQQLVIIDGEPVSTNDISDEYVSSPRSIRPRLSSMEPGTTRPNIFKLPTAVK